MGIAIALGLWGAFLGIVLSNRVGAVAAAAASAYLVWAGLAALQPFLNRTWNGRRVVEILQATGGGEHLSVPTLAGAAALGVLFAWIMFTPVNERRPEWEWDPDHPRYRKKRRRRRFAPS